MKYVPNILTILRLVLVPIFALVYFSGLEKAHYIALIVFLLAGFTDYLDGFLARKYNVISKVGTVLDPLADKLMLLTALGSLAINNAIPVVLFLLFLAKEVFMISAGVFLWNKKENTVIPSSMPGKVATAIAIFTVVMLIIYPNSMFFILLMFIVLILKLVALNTYIKAYKSSIK